VTVGGALLVVGVLVAGALAVLLRSPAEPRSTSAKVGRGCLWAGVSAVGVFSLALVILFALFVRACSEADDPYVVRVVDVNEEGICLDGGPAWVEGCRSRDLIENLPSTIQVGQCLVLQNRHPNTYYLRTSPCPD